MSRSKAFTLVELLVVIAIISVLAAMLLPALQRARESARTVFCTNNQKAIAMAVSAYADDNKGFAVPNSQGGWAGVAFSPTTASKYHPNTWSVPWLLGQYVGNDRADYGGCIATVVLKSSSLFCPADATVNVPYTDANAKNATECSYGFNGSFLWMGGSSTSTAEFIESEYAKMFKLNRYKRTTKAMVAIDAMGARSTPGAYDNINNWYGNIEPVASVTWNHAADTGNWNWVKRHPNGGGATLSFIDGHAKYYMNPVIGFQAGEITNRKD